MLKTITTTIFLLLSYYSLIAQNEIPSNDYLVWGNIKIPLSELVNGTNAIIRLQLDEVLESADAPMVFYKDGKNAKLKSLSIFITKENRTTPPQFVQIEDYDEKDAMNTHGKAFMKAHLHEGEYIYLNNLKGIDGEEHFITIHILYKNPPLVLDFKLPKIPKAEVFGFQIQEIENQKTLVKLDTLDENNQRIFNTYKNYKSYQVIHIPNFKTTRRYLTEKDELIIPNETIINLIENNPIQSIDLSRIPEFSNYDGKMIELKWGEMKSSDQQKLRRDWTLSEAVDEITNYEYEGENYDHYDLMDALGSRFLLIQGFQTYPIQRMKVVLSNQNNPPISYITDDINHPELQKVLEKIEPNTIVLITDILIKNGKGESIYFPPSFLFPIK